MSQANWVIFLHLIALWGSVGIGAMAGWTMPISYFVAVPLGIILWGCGLY
jgi:hypothetical protein